MTTLFEVAERLARRLKPKNLSGLSMAAKMDIVEALNAGLQESYELLPSWKRKTTVSITLPAPVSVNLSVVNGSVDLAAGGSPFTNEQIGRSVVITGDTNWNEVQSTSKLVDEYQGTTGVVPATIYGDSFYSDLTTFDGLLSHPKLADTRKELIPFNPRAEGRAAEIGEPRYYWAEPAAVALGGAPTAFLRVFPAPDRAYVLRVDMEFRPSRISYLSLHQASVVPLEDQYIDRGLIPLCAERLLHSPEWADRSVAQLVMRDAERAREFLSNQRQSVVVPHNRVGTPPGW